LDFAVAGRWQIDLVDAVLHCDCLLSGVDGPTEIILGNAQEVDPGKANAFEGMLETPQHAVVITTVDSDRSFLSLDVSGLLTRVRIWHSHPRWPDKVTIGLG
jgi:hypothetical protein